MPGHIGDLGLLAPEQRTRAHCLELVERLARLAEQVELQALLGHLAQRVVDGLQLPLDIRDLALDLEDLPVERLFLSRAHDHPCGGQPCLPFWMTASEILV
ncbi:MAG: hypothetical protein MZV70_41690 [Desulfobacterales bacterium]|nr:hypothetical protein [Desulfobacterales bacterium]